VQAALSDLILIGDDNRRALKQSIQVNRRTLAELLGGSPIHALHADGGWSAILRLPNVDSEESWIAKLINDAGILAQPGYFFDMGTEPHVIVSLITQPDVFAEGISRMVTCL
jgi:aspartate/methionine/tyrosine aminotransferase